MNETRRGIVASVHQKILNRSREIGRPFNELLQYYAMEKLLLRISKSTYANDFVLKGALRLRSTSLNEVRPTRDIDLLKKSISDLSHVKNIFYGILDVQVGNDGLTFDAGNLEANKISPERAHEGIRITLQANLGAARISMQVDIGFGDVVYPKPNMIEYPTILDGPSPMLWAYPLECVVAEKYHAIVDLGLANSRIKDFYDVYCLCSQYEFDGMALSKSIQHTFESRDSRLPERIPVAFTSVFFNDEQKNMQWRAFIRKIGDDIIPKNFQLVIERISSFLWPLTSRLVRGMNPPKSWVPRTGWTE